MRLRLLAIELGVIGKAYVVMIAICIVELLLSRGGFEFYFFVGVGEVLGMLWVIVSILSILYIAQLVFCICQILLENLLVTECLDKLLLGLIGIIWGSLFIILAYEPIRITMK